MIPEKVEIRLVFDNRKDARDWWSTWIDGGGEDGMGWHTDIEQSEDWTKGVVPKWIRLVKSDA